MVKKLITIGDLVLDIIFPVRLPVVGGQHQPVADRRIEPGGAANTVITARHLGLDVLVVGTIGSDVYGERIREPLAQTGADCRFVVAAPDTASTLVMTLTDRASGEHVFLGHYDDGPEMAYPDGLDEQIEAADALFLSGYTLAEKRMAAVATRALDHAHQHGVKIFMDVGPLLQMADQDQVKWALERTYLLLLTEEEAALVTQGKSGPEAYAELLLQGPTYAIVKRGAEGCTIVTAEWWLEFPGFPVEKVIDTVGAGDTFAAAYIAGVVHGLEIRECARLANATGAACVQKIGCGTNAPTYDEIMAVLTTTGEAVNFLC
ncbi:MAG: carbohydrate kinase family protein [Anaerolineae bacterium]|nr:carbohydrate kinase family protein [Anaerolineae bacterium]